MRSLVLALIFVLASAPVAEAGAWLRAKNNGFASTSVSTNAENELSTSFYGEYGLSDRFTLGADISYGVDRTFFQQGSGILFVRFPLVPTDRTHKWAAHVGVGTRYLQGYFLPAAEVGLSWGRGIQWRDKYGWVNIDSSYNTPQSPADDRIKVDATLGLGLTKQFKVMLQVFNTREGGQTFSQIAPSVLWAPGGGSTTFQLSTEIPIAGGGETAFKVGMWIDF